MLSIATEPLVSPQVVEKSRSLIQQAPRDLLGDMYDDSLVATSGLDEFHDVRPVSLLKQGSCPDREVYANRCESQIYKSNWDRILKVKQKFDPKGRLNGSLLAKACIEDINKMRV